MLILVMYFILGRSWFLDFYYFSIIPNRGGYGISTTDLGFKIPTIIGNLIFRIWFLKTSAMEIDLDWGRSSARMLANFCLSQVWAITKLDTWGQFKLVLNQLKPSCAWTYLSSTSLVQVTLTKILMKETNIEEINVELFL